MSMKKILNPWTDNPEYKCIGCSPDNPIGLHLEFYEEGDEIISKWQPSDNHQGWVNTLHGGVQALIMDEICSWAVSRKLQTAGVTSKMEVRYKHHIPTNEGKITAKARIREQRRNLVTIDAELIDHNGRVCTEATCLYFTFSKEKSEQEMHFMPFLTEDE